jgi:hypothetical protein
VAQAVGLGVMVYAEDLRVLRFAQNDITIEALSGDPGWRSDVAGR